MNILLDSHALLWALHAPERLAPRARTAIRDATNAVFFSAASAWELEIKAAKGKLALPAEWLEVATGTGFRELPVTSRVARSAAHLEWYHTDPFDRMLVAQALERELHIATRDNWISSYGVPVLVC
ncbi:MAG TPA: type II toxin-antitoxin system VapC family toxin [Gemmatimonadaceae bacterium]|nr:type II toxin-antitoxin system VapC family toxin [Gemmatimonadaceae bacterium]